jgi:hypothetical protein
MKRAHTDIVKVAGVPFSFHGRVLVLAALTLPALKQTLGGLRDYQALAPLDQIEVVVNALHASLQRNYPDITRDVIESELLDAGNLAQVLDVVCNSSGLQSKAVNDIGNWNGPVLGEALAA